MPLNCGLLDFGFPLANPGSQRITIGESLADTIEVIEWADELGFVRYWLGEHHSSGMSFGGAPEFFLPVLAGSTERIRVGTGALLVDYYSALKVANAFLLMECLFPGRIDLGMCRSRADDHLAHIALGGSPETTGRFPEDAHYRKVEQVLSLLRNEQSESDPLRGVCVNPRLSVSCQTWMCGGGGARIVAARLGTALCLTNFHHGIAANPIEAKKYRASFVPSKDNPVPYVALAVCGAIADSQSDIDNIRTLWTHEHYPPNVVDTPAGWRRFLREVRALYDLDEIIVLDIQRDLTKRRWGLQILSELTHE